MEAHVRLLDVTKSFGTHNVLQKVCLEIPRGAFVTLLGPSGCGKTTLLRVIAGFFEPDEGEVWIEGKRMNGVPPHRRHTPMVFQDYALFPHMTVRENIGYGLKLRRIPRREVDQRCDRVMGLLDLNRFADRSPGQLSGGQQQRVALARTLVLDPTIILLDEPLSNLDARLRVEIRTEIRELQRRLNLTVVNVTHDQEEAMAVSDLIAVMSGGILAQVGSPSDLYFRPQRRFVAEFIGVANMFPGKLVDRRSGQFVVETDLGVFTAKQGNEHLKVGDRCFVMVRPQGLEFAGEEAGPNRLAAELISHTFLGSTIRYNLHAGGLDLRLDATAFSGGAREAGPVMVGFDAAKAFVVAED
ncbi:MAG: ABC transporter ATP-binding protein [Betaproteobacteria bacterium]